MKNYQFIMADSLTHTVKSYQFIMADSLTHTSLAWTYISMLAGCSLNKRDSLQLINLIHGPCSLYQIHWISFTKEFWSALFSENPNSRARVAGDHFRPTRLSTRARSFFFFSRRFFLFSFFAFCDFFSFSFFAFFITFFRFLFSLIFFAF